MQIFQAACERKPGERSAFLDEACASDAELREEVESLLRHHEPEKDLLEDLDRSISPPLTVDGNFTFTFRGPIAINSSSGCRQVAALVRLTICRIILPGCWYK